MVSDNQGSPISKAEGVNHAPFGRKTKSTGAGGTAAYGLGWRA